MTNKVICGRGIGGSGPGPKTLLNFSLCECYLLGGKESLGYEVFRDWDNPCPSSVGMS